MAASVPQVRLPDGASHVPRGIFGVRSTEGAEMTDEQQKELAKLALSRVERDIQSVAQLMDGPEEIATLLMHLTACCAKSSSMYLQRHVKLKRGKRLTEERANGE